MGRRNGDGLGIIFSVAKTAIKANKAYKSNIAAQERAQKSYNNARERAEKQYENSKRKLHETTKTLEAMERSSEELKKFQYLESGILPDVIEKKMVVDFELLKPSFNPLTFTLPSYLQKALPEPIKQSYIQAVGRKPFLGLILKSKNKLWQKKIENAETEFENNHLLWQQKIDDRDSEIDNLRRKFDQLQIDNKIKHHSKCEEIEILKSGYFSFDNSSVISYMTIVLDKSDYHIGWKREYDIAYSTESKEMIINFKLPNLDIIPIEKDYRYVKILDSIEPKFRKRSEIDTCYKSLISNIALRTIYEVFKSDIANSVSVLTFNGFLIADNPINGKSENIDIISILISRDEYEKIDFRNIVPIRCIQGLSAVISPAPNELVAIKPIREYSMIDKRFVEEEDIISKLDKRPNLMDLNPFEFENLVSNLFSKMGLETKQTRTSKDGGVDAIAFDKRPIIGGKLVIQAKRYKNTVGVSAVRDLYGTLLNEGASKGILVTTSSYGPDAYVFSKDKPIELIDGGGLLYLLKQVGINAKIIMPDIWELG